MKVAAYPGEGSDHVYDLTPEDSRRAAQEAFTQEKEAQILIATDAAGEGINLQRAHLMVNYDLPWNPNRIEQRFGRIHRIGQSEVLHTLLKKLEDEREALGGQVCDVLGKNLFVNRSLHDLIVEAIRYGDQPDMRARLTRVVAEALDHEHPLPPVYMELRGLPEFSVKHLL